MMLVTVTTNPTFAASKPRLLFEKPYAMTHRPDAWQNYDVSPDGQHFLMVKAEQELAATQINVVLNWFEELSAASLQQRGNASRKRTDDGQL